MTMVDLTFLFLSLLIGLLTVVVMKHLLYLHKLPPGPWGFPIVGSMLHLRKVNLFVEFEKYKKKYGPVFSVTLGSWNVVVINGHKLIREAFKQDAFNGRPDFDKWKMRNLGKKNRGILFCDANQTWNQQRRFALKQLKDFGLGKSSMQGLILDELDHLIAHLRKSEKQPLNMQNIFNASVLNSLWLLVSGRRFELNDESFQSVIALLTQNMQRPITSSQVFFSWPARFGIVPASQAKKRFIKQAAGIIKILKADINQHLESQQDNVTRDFIGAYLQEIKATIEPASSFYAEEGKTNLIVVLLDLFVAGSETTSTTLLWAILHMVTNKTIQQKLFNEVHHKIGIKRHPNRNDRASLVYVEAFLNEVHRHASMIPFAVYHKVTAHTEFEGCFVPEGTVVLANLFEAHHNTDYWVDPENFRPERFLNSDGTELIKYEGLIPFSTGKRVCLGEALAKDTLFLFLVGLIQNFSFELDSSSECGYDPKVGPQQANVILAPKPYKVVIKSRN